MARAGAAERVAQMPQKGAGRQPEREALKLDGLIHERVRLGLLCALAAAEALPFTDLKALLETTAGNLSVHARKLEDAGFISCRKSFRERTPHTEYRITAAGRRALESYLGHMEALIRATKSR